MLILSALFRKGFDESLKKYNEAVESIDFAGFFGLK
ncbi:MAG: hypothetical protein RLZZ262_763 [Bacteroidota bacterium]|jgi:hypothetical protein